MKLKRNLLTRHFGFTGFIFFTSDLLPIHDNFKYFWKYKIWPNLIKFDQNSGFDQIWSNLIKFDQIQYFLFLVNQSTKKNKTTQSRNISNDYICRILLLKLLWKLFTTSVTLDKRVILLTKENLVVGHASQGDESHEVQGFCNEEYES